MIRPLLLVSTAALAVAVEVEPAKLATADAAPLDPGTAEVALGGTWSMATRCRDEHGTLCDRGGCSHELGLGVGLTYGLVAGLDAGIAAGWTHTADTAADPDRGSGPSDLAIGAKWRCWEFGDGGLALIPSITAPLGRGQDPDAEIPTASRYWTTSLAVATSGSIGRVGMNADVGYLRALGTAETRDGYRGTLAANAAIGVQISESIQPEIEWSWARDQVDDGAAPWSLAVTAGVQIGLPIGRLGLGIQQVVDGAGTDMATTGIIDLAIACE